MMYINKYRATCIVLYSLIFLFLFILFGRKTKQECVCTTNNNVSCSDNNPNDIMVKPRLKTALFQPNKQVLAQELETLTKYFPNETIPGLFDLTEVLAGFEDEKGPKMLQILCECVCTTNNYSEHHPDNDIIVKPKLNTALFQPNKKVLARELETLKKHFPNKTIPGLFDLTEVLAGFEDEKGPKMLQILVNISSYRLKKEHLGLDVGRWNVVHYRLPSANDIWLENERAQKYPDKKINNWEIGEDVEHVDAKHIAILGRARTGSTFMSELISSHPGVFMSFEPLSRFPFKKMSDKKIEFMIDTLKCKFWIDPIINDYFMFAWFSSENRRWFELCGNVFMDNLACLIPQYMEAVCLKHPIRATKEVKMSVKEASEMLDDKDIGKNLLLVKLVRDPRAILNSMKDLAWSDGSRFQIEIICQQLENDLDDFEQFKLKHPQKIILVRHEDMLLNMEKEVKRLFDFLGLNPDHPYVKEYIKQHMVLNATNNTSVLNTFKDPKKVECRWTEELDISNITAIEEMCSMPMKRLGYRPVANKGTPIPCLEPLDTSLRY